MPGPYPDSLRERAVAASDIHGLDRAAHMFSVGVASLKRWRRLRATTGGVSHRQMGGKRVRSLADKVAEAVAEKPDRILRELADWFVTRLGEFASLSGLSRALKQRRFHRRKKRIEARERSGEAWERRRAAYLEEVAGVPVDRLVFIDESGCQRGMQRREAWSLPGKPVVGRSVRNRGTVTTILSALTTRGLVATMYGEGATTTEVFVAFLVHVLIPVLQPGDVLVMDNLGAHQAAAVRELLARHEIRFILLPPYSPELNPIEEAWSKVKTVVRSLAPQSLAELHRAIDTALRSVSAENAVGWFRHAGLLMKSAAA